MDLIRRIDMQAPLAGRPPYRFVGRAFTVLYGPPSVRASKLLRSTLLRLLGRRQRVDEPVEARRGRLPAVGDRHGNSVVASRCIRRQMSLDLAATRTNRETGRQAGCGVMQPVAIRIAR